MKQNGLNHTLYSSRSWAHPDVKGRETSMGAQNYGWRNTTVGSCCCNSIGSPRFLFFSLKLQEPLAALLRALQAFE